MRHLLVSAGVGVLMCAGAAGQHLDPPAGSTRVPTCDTVYVGPPGGSLYNPLNWEPFFPKSSSVACFPDDQRRVGSLNPPDIARLVSAGIEVRIISSTQEQTGGSDDPPYRTRDDQSSSPPLKRWATPPRLYNPPPPTATGSCCLGSTCAQTDAFDCRELGGYFLPGVGPCTEYVCATGGCCKQDAECVDDDGGGGAMDQELCDIMSGNYLGGALCETDPCQRFRIPQGFEIVEVTPGMETMERLLPRINNCAEIVFGAGIDGLGPSTEIYLYDNGLLTQLTDNDVSDVYPDINDKGTVAWIREYDPWSGGGKIVMLQDGEFTILADGSPASINNLGHVAWDLYTPEPCTVTEYKCDIYFYDGTTVQEFFNDGLSNQGPDVNDHDEIAWDRSVFPCGGGFDDWTSEIMFYSDGVITALPAASSFPHGPTPQLPRLNNLGQAVWDGSLGVEYWDGVNDPILLVPDANGPADINDRGDIAYWGLGAPPLENTVQVWLLRDGVHYPISADPEAKNHSPDLNEAGEIAWKWKDYDAPVASGTRFMRRIRNGDVDFDGDRDLDDFIPMPGCWTGPVPTDHLCECRFFDIDHDRDIDHDDFDLFMRVYTGPLEDCNENEIVDLYDLIDGPSTDCNLNGILDECDLSSGTSQDIDGDGLPDECVAPIPTVSEWGLVALTLLLLLAGSILLTRRRPTLPKRAT